ncbi:MAG: ATP12 family protein [Sphingomonadales bacterium]
MKRFYKKVSVSDGEKGFAITLDGKSVKTPAKEILEVPIKALGDLLAKEWRAQGDKVDPSSMPLNRLANTAIDRTILKKDHVVMEVMGFARFDQLCYRADGPDELIAFEAKAWDPYLEWLLNVYKIKLEATTGIGTKEQDSRALKTLKENVEGHDPFALTALHNATTLVGSLVLALALEKGFRKAPEIWSDAHVDEDYQIGRWGQDAEAKKVREEKKKMWLAIDTFFKALR